MATITQESLAWKNEDLKIWAWGIKTIKSFFEHLDDPVLIKIGKLLKFSKSYTSVKWKLKFGILTWSQVSKTHFSQFPEFGPSHS